MVQAVAGGGQTGIAELVRDELMIGVVGGALLLLVVAIAGGVGPAIGLVAPVPGTLRIAALPALWVAVMLAIAFGMAGIPAMPAIGFITANALLVGLSEELMFRGVLLSALGEMGPRRAVLWTALAFGAVHALNSFVTGEPVQAVLQSLLALGMGFWAGAIRLRTGSLLLPILLHGLWDLALLVGITGETPLALSVVSIVGVVVLGTMGWRALPTETPATAPATA